MKMTDAERFSLACSTVVGSERERTSVGLLQEKTVHAVLKVCYEPNTAYHEVKCGRFVVDVCRDGHIFEIQSRNFASMQKKIAALLEEYTVTVVHPIPHERFIVWVDPETGALSPRRRVIRRGRFTDAGRELFGILPFIGHPNFAVELLLIDMVEYRLRDGRGAEKKKGSHRYDRYPTALAAACRLDSLASYRALLPDLPSPFTAKDFRRAIAGGPRVSPTLLNLLCRLGIVERVGKAGNAFLYTVTECAE